MIKKSKIKAIIEKLEGLTKIIFVTPLNLKSGGTLKMKYDYPSMENLKVEVIRKEEHDS